MDETTLSEWRAQVLRLTACEAADRAACTTLHATRVEGTPLAMTLGALQSYVRSCGGEIEIVLVFGQERRRMIF